MESTNAAQPGNYHSGAKEENRRIRSFIFERGGGDMIKIYK